VRRRLRPLLPRLHVLPALSAIALIGAAQSELGGALADAGSDGDVIVLEADVDALEQLRATVKAPNVSYLVLEADVLPLPDRSVESVRGRSLPAEEIARVTLNLEG
jgi:hypothetical protein